MEKKENVIVAYKGFDKDLKCRGYQFEVGGEYEEPKAEACECGFHACEYPLDVFGYYPPGSSRYCEVEQSGDIDKSNSDKTCSTRIKIGAEIGIAGLVKAAIEYTKSNVPTNITPNQTSQPQRAIEVRRQRAILVIVEENGDNYDIKDWIAAVVDGETVKADTWYKLVDGVLTEV